MVVIIGGGITGLAAAYELACRDVPFTLLEASSRLGGLILTEHADGFTIEAGADSMLVQKPAAIGLCAELGLGPRLIPTRPPRTAYILKDGRLFPLPAPSVLGIPTTWRGVLGYSLLPWSARARLALEPLIPPSERWLAPSPERCQPPFEGDESVGGFFRRRFGRAAAELIADPLLGGIHAGDIDRLSVRSLFQRFVDAEARGSVLLALRQTPRRSADGLFRSLSSGMGELVAGLEGRLPRSSVRLESPARTLARTDAGWRVTAAGEQHDAAAVIIAAPAYVAAALLQDVDRTAARLCGEMPYVSTVSVALAWPRSAISHPLSGSGFVVARTHRAPRITACTWVSSKWEGRAPAGHALLRAYLGGAHDPAAIDLPDAEIVDIAARDIGSVLGIAGPPELSRVYRWRDAGAQHHVGQLARMSAIENRLAAHPGLFVAGSGFRSIGIPDCVVDGRAAAAAAGGYATMNA